ncbi:ubiquitin domain-containing protein Dsk2p [[Candida] jaroonii]|uniref:Ubiquitin domain-containing protein Dsk2p n=1 Tax=[Candida] jaroonii TaxID=467808 RepID=A0ACA9Y7A8_9ASCO|nr:ubiquitin domain-containing protein Dsk2p [[Candida] jaroonii]
MSDSITINIKSSGDSKYEVTISPSQTVLELKNEVAAKADVPADRQRLIYSGKVLKDNEVISTYKIQSGHTVHLVKSAAAKPAPATSSTTSTSTPSATTTTSGNNGVPSNISSGSGAFNPLADLTGARYAGYTQLPSASMFGPDGGMNNAMPDPEQMSQMMSNPMFQESMNSLLSNPQMLDYMIQQSPQLRAMGPQAREMLQSPFFRQMLSNPDMMRSMMQMSGGLGGAGAPPSFPAPGSNPTVGENDSTTEGTNTPAANPFASMFGGQGAGGAGGFPPIDPFALFGGQGGNTPVETDNRPPEERYESQLSQLNDMGFFDFDRNVAALRRSGGNVQGAVEYLLSE